MFASNDKEASFLNQKAAKNFLSFYIYEPDIKELTKEIFTMIKKQFYVTNLSLLELDWLV